MYAVEDVPYSAKFWHGETLTNPSFQSFGEENAGEFTIANISYFSEFGFGWVKYWQMTFVLPNSPTFSPTKILHYTDAVVSYLAYLVAFPVEVVSFQGVVAFLYPSLREVAYQVGASLLLRSYIRTVHNKNSSTLYALLS